MLVRLIPLLLLAVSTRCSAMILYQIEPSQPEYLLQQQIDLSLRIENQGETSVELPCPDWAENSVPIFAISGPGFAQAQQFSNWSSLHPGVDPTEAPAPGKQMTLAPSETWEGQLPLSSMVSLRQPGEYRIGSMLLWQTGQARSPNRTFRVDLPKPYSITLGTGSQRPFDQGEGQLAFLQRGTAASTLYSARFSESDPSNSEMTIDSLVRRIAVPAQATDLSSPYRNTTVFDEFLQWLIWREGRSIKALHTAATVPASFDLPGDPAYLVRPALKGKGGPIEVLAVSSDQRHLSMVSIPAVMEPKPSLAWQIDLPGAPQSITATLASEEKGSVRHIAFVLPHPHGFEIFHTTYQAGQQPVAFRSTRVEQGELLPNSPLTMLVTGDGAAHVALLVKLGAGEYALVEALFAQGAPAAPVLSSPWSISGDVTAAAVLYTEKEGQIVRRDAAVIADGSLQKLEADKVARRNANAFVPLLMTSGQAQDYVLCQAVDGSFFFEPL